MASALDLESWKLKPIVFDWTSPRYVFAGYYRVSWRGGAIRAEIEVWEIKADLLKMEPSGALVFSRQFPLVSEDHGVPRHTGPLLIIPPGYSECVWVGRRDREEAPDDQD